MFDKEKLLAYMGKKNGSFCAGGLSLIETTYAVSIDDEFQKDSCTRLLDRLSDDKRNALSNEELTRCDELVSHLKKYIELMNRFIAFEGRQDSAGNSPGDKYESLAPQDTHADYWPPLKEYDPGITREMWLAVLKDRTITTPDNLAMFKMMLELGGESTCSHLAKAYGNVHSYYNKLGSSFGEKVKKKLNCPDYDDNGITRCFTIPFVGRNIMEDGRKRYSWKLRDELREALATMGLTATPAVTNTDIGLNTILYGPPGTGKTYHSVIYAVAIIENKELAAVLNEEYSAVLERFNEYRAKGRVEFTTFHQSYSYEEFIEGIKPAIVSDDDSCEAGEIQYSIKPGIFKRFCEKAQFTVAGATDYGIRDSPNIWKVSLFGTGENPIRTECLEHNHIRIGWGDEHGKTILDKADFSIVKGKRVLNAFLNRMQIGDVVLSCYNASTIDAIGVVSGEPEWDDTFDKFNWLRKVKWIVKNIKENIMGVTGGVSMTLACVYRMNGISLAEVLQIINKYHSVPSAGAGNRDKYVFIIDEINRGNISKIFGELITLIEDAKRVGRPEGMKAVLPYSLKAFGVPENVYLIGTMNTADRSIAAIDTALRRRFLFKEMMPRPEILSEIRVEDLSISVLLSRINRRIAALYDREHTIGHAYFLPLKNSPTIEMLADIFANNIMPLLQEYFYEDYEKIRLVLGDNKKKNKDEQFIIAKDNDYAELFGNIDLELDDSRSYEINSAAFGNIEAYRSI